jgi:cytochrome P450
MWPRVRRESSGRVAPRAAGGDPLIGHLRQIREDGPGFFTRLMREKGDLVRFGLPRLECYLASHPDLVREVLQDKVKSFSKSSRGYDVLRRFLGDGLLTSEGSRWLRQRKVAQPAFHRDRLAAFAPIMVSSAEEEAARWSGLERAPFDVSEEMTRLALKIAGLAFMSTDVSDESDKVRRALAFLSEDAMRRINSAFELPLSLPTEANRRYERSVRDVDSVLYGLIDRRRRGESQGYDLLAMLMEAKDEQTGEWMTDRQLRDEMMTMFVAGHETSAVALTWTWYCLSLAPDAEARLHAEVDALGRAPKAEDVARLRVTGAVVREAMRLFPPAWTIARTAIEDATLGDYEVSAGSLVFVSPYATHRHPAFWPDPDAFDLERFEPARQEARHRFAYIPFGAGPRVCIGATFAIMELVLVVATIARRWRLALEPGHRIELLSAVTMRTRHGVKMRALPRR